MHKIGPEWDDSNLRTKGFRKVKYNLIRFSEQLFEDYQGNVCDPQ